MNQDFVLDAKGMACPMPIVKTKKKMKELEKGQVLKVEATDQGAKQDFAAWANSTGNELVKTTENGEVLSFWIKKGE
ncbi:sulfurtransferase TusA family protein [Geomicrobium sediminis]|uniref:TusA-related sulfurtransferase n=1 Tax=Geomicrobium sediminis TaxID=1347788 RepID=A0ABS2PFR5_9BACL|nr:sulfurtransferase TusA family protein [Geomicrobium sediminis]EZH64200.1 hypothetical protein DH09_00230 [Bacillaceae bacterium JMAK1]MBM7634278.1 TusA-related sulfurtransferase [Geomicrobium sediminis]